MQSCSIGGKVHPVKAERSSGPILSAKLVESRTHRNTTPNADSIRVRRSHTFSRIQIRPDNFRLDDATTRRSETSRALLALNYSGIMWAATLRCQSILPRVEEQRIARKTQSERSVQVGQALRQVADAGATLMPTTLNNATKKYLQARNLAHGTRSEYLWEYLMLCFNYIRIPATMCIKPVRCNWPAVAVNFYKGLAL